MGGLGLVTGVAEVNIKSSAMKAIAVTNPANSLKYSCIKDKKPESKYFHFLIIVTSEIIEYFKKPNMKE